MKGFNVEIIMTKGHPVRDCVDLKATFGEHYRCEFEESYQHEKNKQEERAWLTIIPCKRGHIYPHGGRTLTAYLECGRGQTRTKLESLDFIDTKFSSSEEAVYLFDAEHFEVVAEIAGAKKRRRLSPEHRSKSESTLRRLKLKKPA